MLKRGTQLWLMCKAIMSMKQNAERYPSTTEPREVCGTRSEYVSRQRRTSRMPHKYERSSSAYTAISLGPPGRAVC